MNGMYDTLNTTVLENDKYQIVNETDEDICYYTLEREFQNEVKSKAYVSQAVTYYETELKAITKDEEYKIEYTVVSENDFFSKRYGVNQSYIQNEKEIIINENMANIIFGTTDIIGEKLKIGEISSDYSVICTIIGVRTEGIESDIARVYVSEKMLEEIAEQKLEGWICATLGVDNKLDSFCKVHKLAEDETILYGRTVKNEQEIVIDVKSVHNYFEQLGYRCSEQEILNGKLSKKLQNMILKEELIIYSNCNVLKKAKIVGIVEKKQIDDDIVGIYGNALFLDNLKKCKDYHMDIYLSDLSENNVAELEASCEKYGYTIKKANAATINSLMSRIMMIVLAFSIFGIILTIASIVIVFAVTKLDIITRMYEIGVLKTLGASNGKIFQLLLTHNFLLGMISSISVVVIIAVFCIFKVDKLIEIAGYQIYQSSILQCILILIIGIIISILAGSVPIFNASKTEVKDALKMKG